MRKYSSMTFYDSMIMRVIVKRGWKKSDTIPSLDGRDGGRQYMGFVNQEATKLQAQRSSNIRLTWTCMGQKLRSEFLDAPSYVQASYLYLLWPFFTPQTLEPINPMVLEIKCGRWYCYVPDFACGFPFLRCSFCWYLTFLGTPRSDKTCFSSQFPSEKNTKKKTMKYIQDPRDFHGAQHFLLWLESPPFPTSSPLEYQSWLVVWNIFYFPQ